MPLTVRYPNGARVTYNRADNVAYGADGCFKLLNRKGEWIALLQGSSGAIVESGLPCAVTGPGESDDVRLKYVLENLRRMDLTLLRELKAALTEFNATTHCWG